MYDGSEAKSNSYLQWWPYFLQPLLWHMPYRTGLEVFTIAMLILWVLGGSPASFYSLIGFEHGAVTNKTA